MTQGFNLQGLVKSPHDIVRISYNYFWKERETLVGAWTCQRRIDELVKAGCRIQKVEVVKEAK